MSRGHRFGHHEPIEETLALLPPPPTIPSVIWTNVPAGGTAVIPAGHDSAFAFDTTGARDNAPLPAAPADGLVVILKAVGASNTNGILITPATGQSVEDPGTPGTVLAPNATALISGQGASITYKYQLLGNRWLIASNA